jgi:hypothetical protein
MPEPEKKITIWGELPSIELVFAILLLISTISSAFCVYQATRWSGTQSILFVESSKMRTESIRAHNEATAQRIVDITIFLNWIDARSQDDPVRADFLESRFTARFIPAFAAWVAQVEGRPAGSIPPGTPFQLPEYRLDAQELSDRLEENATAAFNQGKEANQISDNYILNTVLFTLVLFLCGVGQRWENPHIKRLILLMAIIFFIIAMALFLSLPKNIGF